MSSRIFQSHDDFDSLTHAHLLGIGLVIVLGICRDVKKKLKTFLAHKAVP